MDFRLLDKAADAFMDIGFSDDGLQTALDGLDKAFGSSGTVLLPITNRVPGPLPASHSARDGLEYYIRNGWFQHDERMGTLHNMLRRGVTTDHDFIDEAGMARSAYYQECLRPFGWKWFMGIRVNIGNEIWAASLQRGAAKGAFTPEEQGAAVRIVEKISRGVTIATSLKLPSVASMSAFYDAFAAPTLLLNRAGGVVYLNRAAEALIGRGMSVIGKRLVVNRDDNACLQNLISALVAFDEYPSPHAYGKVVVRRQHGRPLVFSGQTLKVGPALDYFLDARAILTIVDPDRVPPHRADVLINMFGLSSAEARIAIALFENNGGAADIADVLGLTHNTVKSYMKSVFEKTQVHSQTQLVVLMYRIFERMPAP